MKSTIIDLFKILKELKYKISNKIKLKKFKIVLNKIKFLLIKSNNKSYHKRYIYYNKLIDKKIGGCISSDIYSEFFKDYNNQKKYEDFYNYINLNSLNDNDIIKNLREFYNYLYYNKYNTITNICTNKIIFDNLILLFKEFKKKCSIHINYFNIFITALLEFISYKCYKEYLNLDDEKISCFSFLSSGRKKKEIDVLIINEKLKEILDFFIIPPISVSSSSIIPSHASNLRSRLSDVKPLEIKSSIISPQRKQRIYKIDEDYDFDEDYEDKIAAKIKKLSVPKSREDIEIQRQMKDDVDTYIKESNDFIKNIPNVPVYFNINSEDEFIQLKKNIFDNLINAKYTTINSTNIENFKSLLVNFSRYIFAITLFEKRREYGSYINLLNNVKDFNSFLMQSYKNSDYYSKSSILINFIKEFIEDISKIEKFKYPEAHKAVYFLELYIIYLNYFFGKFINRTYVIKDVNRNVIKEKKYNEYYLIETTKIKNLIRNL